MTPYTIDSFVLTAVYSSTYEYKTVFSQQHSKLRLIIPRYWKCYITATKLYSFDSSYTTLTFTRIVVATLV